MKLSEAAKFGITLRPEGRERFCNIENRGLSSDFWGAACEAVQPSVAKFNWDTKDKVKLAAVMDAFNAVQLHYFADYFNPEKMPARCPGANRSYQEVGAKIVGSNGQFTAQTRVQNIGAVTSECDKVAHLAGMADHLFYAHNWSREKVAHAVELYENQQDKVFRSFEHFQNESLRQRISLRVNSEARQRERERAARRRIFSVS